MQSVNNEVRTRELTTQKCAVNTDKTTTYRTKLRTIFKCGCRRKYRELCNMRYNFKHFYHEFYVVFRCLLRSLVNE